MSEKCQRLEKIFLITLLNYFHPVHDVDKLSILHYFAFAGLIRVQALNPGLGVIINNPVLLQQFIHYRYTILLYFVSKIL